MIFVPVVRPGLGLVEAGAGREAAVQDADQPVGKLAEGGVVAGAAGAQGTRSALARLTHPRYPTKGPGTRPPPAPQPVHHSAQHRQPPPRPHPKINRARIP